MPERTESESRKLLRRLRDTLATTGGGQDRLDRIEALKLEEARLTKELSTCRGEIEAGQPVGLRQQPHRDDEPDEAQRRLDEEDRPPADGIDERRTDHDERLYHGTLPVAKGGTPPCQQHDWDEESGLGFYFLCKRCGTQEWPGD